MLTSMAYTVSEWSVRFEDSRSTRVERIVDAGQHGFGPHHRLYETADGWIYVECATDGHRRAFDAAVGAQPEVVLRALHTADALSRLADAEIPAVRADGIDHAAFMLHDPHCVATGIAVDAEQPGLPRYRRAGPAVRFATETPLAPSPGLGDDTAAVLAELGCTADEIDELERSGVTRPVGHGLPG
jgi:crotonobetainyl-CoA:carnitine CoA-transferase CaiB-like acyl-CoA transferase